MSRLKAKGGYAHSAKEAFTVTVENESITVAPRLIPLDEVQLDPDNPRIREYLREKKIKNPTAKVLGDAIWSMPGVPELYTSIRENGGLLERILVRSDGLVVEGNCRTVSYLHLREAFKGKPEWEKIPAMQLPPGVTPRQIAVIQAWWHVKGKKEWSPVEQAGQLHYMNRVLKMEPEAIGRAIGLSTKVVARSIENYEDIQLHVLPKLGREAGVKKYSYIEEFNKNKNLKEFREKKGAKKWFMNQVVKGKFTRGEEVRSLHKIVNNKRAKQTFEQEGHKAALAELSKKDPTVGSPVFKKLEAASGALNALSEAELERIGSDKAAQALLRSLYLALTSTARLANVKLT